MPTINPYLTFNGECLEAFNFYKSVFGGDIIYTGRFKDMPPEFNVPEKDREKIMHIALPIGEHTILMGSDTSSAMGGPVKPGTNFSIAIDVESEEEADRIFNALSEGGQADMSMQKMFWGAYFGSLKDKFGIAWMVSYEYGEE